MQRGDMDKAYRMGWTAYTTGESFKPPRLGRYIEMAWVAGYKMAEYCEPND